MRHGGIAGTTPIIGNICVCRVDVIAVAKTPLALQSGREGVQNFSVKDLGKLAFQASAYWEMAKVAGAVAMPSA
jgi:hypothetical protein